MQLGRLALLARLLAVPAAAINVRTQSQSVRLADGQGPAGTGTCEKYRCPDNMIAKDDDTFIVGNTDAACCDPTCATFTCPAGTTKVPGDVVIGNSKEECCNMGQQTCDKFVCPAGYALKSLASARTGSNLTSCCYQAESVCHWWGGSHFTTFGGGRFDVAPVGVVTAPGHYYVAKGPHFGIQAEFCPLGSTSCSGPGPLVMRRMALKPLGDQVKFMFQVQGKKYNATADSYNMLAPDEYHPDDPQSILAIEPLGNNITWGGKVVVGPQAGDFVFTVSGNSTKALLVRQTGSELRVMLNNAVRLVVSRDNGFLSAQLYARQSLYPGDISGACGNWTGPGTLVPVPTNEKMLLLSDVWTYVTYKSVPKIVTDRFNRAVEERTTWLRANGRGDPRADLLRAVPLAIGIAGAKVLRESWRKKFAVFVDFLTGRQTPPCTTTADQTAATTACKAQSASSNANWLATCIADFCLSAPSLRTNVASGSAAFYSATTAAIANTKPVVVSAVAAGSACPVGTVPSVAHSATERSLLTAGFTYCNPARPLSIVGLVASSAIASACGSMQPVVPRSLAEQQKVAILARQSGTTQLWIGGTFNTVSGLWVWPDGTRITEWPGGTALTRTQFTASGGFLCTTACATSPCPWVACGGTATRIVVCEARLASGSR